MEMCGLAIISVYIIYLDGLRATSSNSVGQSRVIESINY